MIADTIREVSSEDILRWPDGTWCFRCDLEQMSHMSDDFEVITEAHPEYHLIIDGEI